MNHDDEQDPKPAPDPSSAGDQGNAMPIDASNWLDDRYPLVDADFVDETLDRVLQDQSEIAAEADQVDAFKFNAGDLAKYTVPEPSPGFVEQTLAKALAERRSGRWSVNASETEFADLLQEFEAPEPSTAFVDRTLAAILSDRQERQLGATVSQLPTSTRPGTRPGPVRAAAAAQSSWRRRFSIAASLAAAVLLVIALSLPDGDATDGGQMDFQTNLQTVQASPVSFAVLIVDSDAATDTSDPFDDFDTGLTLEDPLTGFANPSDRLGGLK